MEQAPWFPQKARAAANTALHSAEYRQRQIVEEAWRGQTSTMKLLCAVTCTGGSLSAAWSACSCVKRLEAFWCAAMLASKFSKSFSYKGMLISDAINNHLRD
jgi:hypothetical protein